jgi:hypothetical protein
METEEMDDVIAEGIEAPYSLGKLIEWKLGKVIPERRSHLLETPPYSLGKLIEWKHGNGKDIANSNRSLPTR